MLLNIYTKHEIEKQQNQNIWTKIKIHLSIESWGRFDYIYIYYWSPVPIIFNIACCSPAISHSWGPSCRLFYSPELRNKCLLWNLQHTQTSWERLCDIMLTVHRERTRFAFQILIMLHSLWGTCMYSQNVIINSLFCNYLLYICSL